MASRLDPPGMLSRHASIPETDDIYQNMDEVEKYDFIELYAFDVECVPRGRLIERRRFQQILENKGLGIHAALCFYTKDGKPLGHHQFSTKLNAGNVTLRPDLTTLSKAQKAAVGDHKVGQVIGDPTISCSGDNPSWTYECSSPRNVARWQVKQLRTVQRCTIHYNFEMELTLLDGDSQSPIDKDTSWGDMIKLMKREEMMLDLLTALPDTGVSCATFHCEAGPSQFEYVLTFAQDLKGADMAARFKKESSFFFEKKGMKASFSSFNENIGTNFTRTMHLNHYLRSLENVNIFNNGGPGMSELAHQWTAGIHAHLPALMALYCPTENCYRRFTNKLRKSLRFYSTHQRGSCLRQKQDGKEKYQENRLPSSAANPYLVLAGTIAAGRYGIANAMQLTEEKQVNIPSNLLEALDKLDEDVYLKEELNCEFIDAFIAKKKYDLKYDFENPA